ncbi:unnamed protein product [Phytomonas sp. Hart1]|nr:unnamed protein product [Phytomonas sp. Hart1]|eukprot:CCW69391.1 unnamed protein product [Phytomonas sp. isolate Hart1]
MDLDFSHKGLFIFDASEISKGLEGCIKSSDEIESVLSKFLEHAPSVKAINLSNNSIHRFMGGRTLRTVTVLDLAFNSLTTLQSSSLPPALVKLNLFHNQLTCLDMLDRFLPSLEELNAGHNALASDGIRNLPVALLNLNLQSNKLEDLASLSTVKRLVKLDLSENRLTTPGELGVLKSMSYLRYLSIQDNLFTQDPFDLQSIVRNVAPWILNLNGVPLSHVEGNKIQRDVNAKLREERITLRTHRNRSCSPSRMHIEPCIPSTHSTAGPKIQFHMKNQSTKEFLVETKLKELEKMLAKSQKEEQQAFKQHELLLNQVKGCAKVIQDQAEQLETLRKTISTLKKDEEMLKKSTSEADRAFEQTHVSILTNQFTNSTHS